MKIVRLFCAPVLGFSWGTAIVSFLRDRIGEGLVFFVIGCFVAVMAIILWSGDTHPSTEG